MFICISTASLPVVVPGALLFDAKQSHVKLPVSGWLHTGVLYLPTQCLPSSCANVSLNVLIALEAGVYGRRLSSQGR